MVVHPEKGKRYRCRPSSRIVEFTVTVTKTSTIPLPLALIQVKDDEGRTYTVSRAELFDLSGEDEGEDASTS